MDARTVNIHVNARMGYLLPTRERPYQYMYEPPNGKPQSNCSFDHQECLVVNGRQLGSSLTLDVNGFELLNAPSEVADFYDERQVTGTYYAEVERLATHLTGGVRARVFDHQLRQREAGRPRLGMGRHGDGANPAAVGWVHNDYTEASGARRLKMVFPDTEEERPFMILNFWRPVRNPAIDTPLAVCDARSIRGDDWVECDTYYPNRQGEIYLARHAHSHRWYYYPRMETNEVLVFKSYDSRRDVPARMTPHCAFDDPTTPANAPLRRSIEIRCLVVLE